MATDIWAKPARFSEGIRNLQYRFFRIFQCSWPALTLIHVFSERAPKNKKNEGLADIWRQFSRNLEQNFDFRDFRGSRVTSCRKWRHNDVMMTLTQIFLCHSSWLELVYNTAKAFRLRPSRSAISSGGVIFTPPPCRIGGKKSPCRIGLNLTP